MKSLQRTSIALLVALVVAACANTSAPPGAPIPAGARYVAMGSSFAAGPGITPYFETSPAPCYRSTDNYARQLARRKDLDLVDVSCSGATTQHLLGPREAIPPQLDALNASTKLVTITIGGNDLGYIGRLVTSSCAGLSERSNEQSNCAPIPALPSEQDYIDLQERMNRIAAEVRSRAPDARLVFVDYLTVLPATGRCAATPLSEIEADRAREVARRLASITAATAAANGADVIKASESSAEHGACAPSPWMHGYPTPETPVAGTQYHPNLPGMTAIADALERKLWN